MQAGGVVPGFFPREHARVVLAVDEVDVGQSGGAAGGVGDAFFGEFAGEVESGEVVGVGAADAQGSVVGCGCGGEGLVVAPGAVAVEGARGEVEGGGVEPRRERVSFVG